MKFFKQIVFVILFVLFCLSSITAWSYGVPFVLYRIVSYQFGKNISDEQRVAIIRKANDYYGRYGFSMYGEIAKLYDPAVKVYSATFYLRKFHSCNPPLKCMEYLDLHDKAINSINHEDLEFMKKYEVYFYAEYIDDYVNNKPTISGVIDNSKLILHMPSYIF